MKEKLSVSDENKQSRRDVLKRAGVASAFIMPTITSYAMANFIVIASGKTPPPPPSGGY
jgi:hypothetical protein